MDGVGDMEGFSSQQLAVYEEFKAWRPNGLHDYFDLMLGFASGRGLSHDDALELAVLARRDSA